ncbi:MAG: outer membrane protein assembly factor BamA [Pseudomonadota bacterium]
MDDRGGVCRRANRGFCPSIRESVLGIRLAILAVIGSLFLASAVAAQTFRFTEFEVQGNQRIETATILTTLGVEPGQTISAGRLNDGFQRLQASDLFETVEIVPQGNKLLIIVQEFPTINRVAIEGNERLSDEDLLTIVTSTPRRVYSPATAARDAEAITEAYAVAGRLSATVRPQIIRRSDNRVDLIFEVAEGRVTEIERISFVGNRVFSDRRLRRVLETTQAGLFRFLIGTDTFVEDRVAFDIQLLRDFYLSRGYADFQVLSATPELAPTRDAFFLTFRLQEGQQFRFGAVSASTVLPEIDLDLYESEIRVDPGDIFTPQAVDRTIERLELLATREGLTFVRVTPRVTRNDEDLTLDVEFVIERGERLFIERIDIEGNSTTLDRVIRRQFPVVEGDPFNPREIRAAAERIRALGYFESAEVDAREGTSPEQVIIDVDVVEQPTGSLGFGLNFSAERGVGVAVSFAETNFLGRGQVLNLGVDAGAEQTNIALTFVEPFFLNRDLALSLGVNFNETDDDDQTFETQTISFRPGLDFPIGEFSRLGVFYSFSVDDLDPSDVTSLSSILLSDLGDEVTSSIGYRYSYSTIGRGLDPTRGVLLQFGQEFAGVGGDAQFVKTTGLVRGQQAIRNEEIVLSAALEGGALVSFGDDESLQANRFFNTQRIIRGFETAGIGPRDLVAGDDALGGNLFIAARFEAQFPIAFIPEEYGISGAAFIDFGSFWSLDNTDGGPDGLSPVDDSFFLNSAIGVGILWDTAVGPLRFNFTEAINSRSFDEEQSFDLTIETRF